MRPNNLPRYRSLTQEQQEQYTKLFKVSKKTVGSVICIPKTGNSDVFVVSCGTVVLFAANYQSNPINKNYNQPFIIVACHRNEGVFNESRLLLNRDSDYGALIVEDDAELFSLEREGLNKIAQEETTQTFRSVFLCKDRLYKNLLSKIGSKKTNDEVEAYQQLFCQKNRLNFNEIKAAIYKNYKNGVIESSDKQEQRDKNLKLFEQKMGNNPLKTALNSMSDREKTLCMGTPRIAHGKKDGFLGLTAQQENSLFALRSFGMNMRSGNATTNSVLPVPKEQISQTINSLLEEEKALAQEIASKKGIGDKKLKNLVDEEENQKDEQNQTINKKLGKSQEELLRKLEEQKEQSQTLQTQEVSIKIQSQDQNNLQIQFQKTEPKNSSEEFVGRSEQRKVSNGMNSKQSEIAQKRKSLLKLGI